MEELELERIIIETNRFIRLVVEGYEVEKQLPYLARYHGHMMEDSVYEFLFFARDWFEERGFDAKIEVAEGVKGIQRMIMKIGLKIINRRR